MPLYLSKQTRIVAWSVAAALACGRQPDIEQNVERDAPHEPSQPAPAKIQPYPLGRWRLVDSNALSDTLLWVSHILVRHRDAKNADPAFAVADWHSRSSGGQRSRREALALAEQLRERAAGHAQPFSALASLHSEDVATQPLGGSLGGIPALQLVLWPEVLDALAALRPGDVSQVVETSYGFHIFERRAPPPAQTVSGAHIVIAHDEARWIRVLGRGATPSRSRAEALAFANELYERAKQRPAAFSQLVEQYSEHVDAVRGGDMGAWSTREPSFIPREVEVLAKLAVGEVAAPLDSPVGFQIIVRTPDRERELLAMDAIRLSFDPLRDAPDPLAKPAVQAKATELARLLREDSSRFSDLKKENCCNSVEQWQEGRVEPTLTTALLGLRVGEIATEPVESLGTFVIAQRVAPRPAAVSVSYELPSPEAPDIATLLRSRDASFVRSELQKLGDEVLATLSLPEATAARVRRLHHENDHFAQLGTSDSRAEAFNSLLSEVAHVLDATSYTTYLTLVNAHFERVLLQGG